MGQFFDSLRWLGLLPQVGVTMASSILLTAWAGKLLGEVLGWNPGAMIAGIVLGTGAGFTAVYKLLMKGLHTDAGFQETDRKRSDPGSSGDAVDRSDKS